MFPPCLEGLLSSLLGYLLVQSWERGVVVIEVPLAVADGNQAAKLRR